MELLSSNTEKNLGNGNPEKIPYILGNENPKKNQKNPPPSPPPSPPKKLSGNGTLRLENFLYFLKGKLFLYFLKKSPPHILALALKNLL